MRCQEKKNDFYCIYGRNDQILAHLIGKEIYIIAWKQYAIGIYIRMD